MENRYFWKEIRFFKPEEFKSPDSDEDLIREFLVKAMDYVRKQYGSPLHINSGYRTKEHNAEVGGVPNSQHVRGTACDVHIESQAMGDELVKHFIDFVGEACGIGRYRNFVHLDIRRSRARWDNR